MKQLSIILFVLSNISVFAQNCDRDFTGAGTTKFSEIPCAGYTLGTVDIQLGDGDIFIFDAPTVINMNKLDINATGSGTVIIPKGVTINIVDDPMHFHKIGGDCDDDNPCNFNFIVDGILNVDKDFKNELAGLTVSGTGRISVTDELKNESNACMQCGTSCPAFPSGDRCTDNGDCGTNFCGADGNYGNDNALLSVDAGEDQKVCLGTEVTLSADPAGGAGTWSPSTGISDINDPSTTVSGLSVGTHIYTWTNASGSDNMTIEVIALPDQPTIISTLASVCLGTSVNLTSSDAPNSGSYIWYRDGTATGQTDKQITVFGLLASGDYQVEVIDGLTNCRSIKSIAKPVTIINQPDQPGINVNGNTTLCEGSTVTLSTPELPDGDYIWYKNGSQISVNREISLDQVSQSGGYTVVVINSAGCNSGESNEEVITIQPAPSPAQVENDKLLCDALSTQISAVDPAVGTGMWSIVSGSGIIANPSTFETSISNLQSGTETTLTWTVGNGVCEANTSNLVLTVRSSPSIAVGGDDQQLCAQKSTVLAAQSPTIGNGEWNAVPNGIVSFEDPNAPNTTVTSLVPGTNVDLVWTVSNECGSNFDNVFIENEKMPDIAAAGIDQELCDIPSTQLKASGQGGRWSVTGGSAVIDDPSDPNTDISGLNYGTTICEWTINGKICKGNSDVVNITNYKKPIAEAGGDLLFCDGETVATLAAGTPSVGSGEWSAPGDIVIEDINNPNSEVSDLPLGNTKLTWTVSNGSCEVVADNMIIATYPSPAIKNGKLIICQGGSVQLGASGGDSYHWSPANGLSADNVASPTASPRSSTTYMVAINNDRCGQTNFPVEVVVNPVPDITISPDSTIFMGTSIQLFASGAVSYSWTPVDGLDRADIANPVASPPVSTTYTVTGTNQFDCPAKAEVSITVDQQFEIFVPELFTPNGDKHNDVLMVNTLGMKRIEFKIFDRRGKELFSTQDPNRGWDGHYNGKEQLTDTYVYYVYGETFEGEPVSKKGSFQLLR